MEVEIKFLYMKTNNNEKNPLAAARILSCGHKEK